MTDPLELAVDIRTHAASLAAETERLLAIARRIEQQHRARRMEQVACALLESGMLIREVVSLLRARFGISRQHAYRVVDRAMEGGPL